jgi:putative ABC transport system permease protein
MLSFEFIMLVLIACFIGVPVGWYVMDKWLQNFVYHINLGAGLFATAAIMSIVIAIGTVGSKTIRSALRNPVDSLRSE